MNAPRVCAITCDCYPDDPLVRRTSEAAASAGYDYHVICAQKNGQGLEEVFNGVQIHRLYMRGRHGKPLGRITGNPFVTTVFLWLYFTVLAMWKVGRLHLKERFDVIHVHNLPDFLVFAALIPKLFGAKVILHVQDVSPELMASRSKPISRRITFLLANLQERISTAFADHVVTVGWPFEKLLLQRGVHPQRLSSILNSADPNLFRSERRTEPFLGQPSADRPLIFMYHGTFGLAAGLDLGLRAFAKALSKAPHIRLHLKGGGPAIDDLKQLTQDLNIGDHVTFYPGGPVDEVVTFISQGDVGIIPYRSNGFMDLLLPTKAYEFALMRRPMIVSSTVATRSMFRQESVAFCQPGDEDGLVEAMIDLYNHPLKRSTLIANAEEDYLPYHWEEMAERYRQLLKTLAMKGPKQMEGSQTREMSA
jgi:glycosyltransferase involved in cell wall biosynthesis